MLVFLISFIEWTKLIIGCALIIMGSCVMLFQFYNWFRVTFRSRSLPVLGWLVQAGLTIAGLIVLFAGFYIAGW